MDYVRGQVTDPKLSAVRQRVRWWSAIALLRCLASSPAAAEQTLLNRSAVAAVDDEDEVDVFAEPRVLDSDLDDTLEGEDITVGADTAETDSPVAPARRRLRELAQAAAALKGVRSDAKLKRLIPLIKELLAEGYHPIVFCRFIPTADQPAVDRAVVDGDDRRRHPLCGLAHHHRRASWTHRRAGNRRGDGLRAGLRDDGAPTADRRQPRPTARAHRHQLLRPEHRRDRHHRSPIPADVGPRRHRNG